MKKTYIEPKINIVSIKVKAIMTVSGEGTMNARESIFEDDYWHEDEFESLEIEDNIVEFI